MRYGENKTVHESMIRSQISAFENMRHSDIKADHIVGYEEPEEINGYVPDIISTKDKKIITEVETSDSYSSDHTRRQYDAFCNISGAEFHVVVPESCLEKAKAKAREWGIKVDQWWYNSKF